MNHDDSVNHSFRQASDSHSSTRSLVRRGRVGDNAALDRVFGRLVTRLRRWAHGRLSRGARDVTDTVDIVQDAVLRAWRKVDTIDLQRPGDLEAYTRHTARNLIRDRGRALGRTPERAELHSDVQHHGKSPLEEAANREFFDRFATVLDTLDAREREILVARFEMGYSYEQLAELFDRPSAAAARMHVNRLVARMQRRLKINGDK